MRLIIKVAVKPYIKKFILKNVEGDEPIYLNARTSCLIVDKVNDLLTRPQRHLYGKETPNAIREYTETVKFSLNPKRVHLYGIDLSPDKLIHFNNFIDKLIRDRLFLLLDSMAAFDSRANVQSTIRNFLNEYDLEESGLNFHTLLKAYCRYKEEKAPILPADNIIAFKKTTTVNTAANAHKLIA